MTGWGNKNVLNYYTINRDKISDVYKSELVLLKKIKKNEISTIYDFGCATGGFYKVFQKLFGNISYFGDDYEKKSIIIAKQKFKGNKNFQCRQQGSKNLKIKNKYDLTFSTSVLHHVRNYRNVIQKLIKSSKKYVFFDAPRVSFFPTFLGKINLSQRFPDRKIKKKNYVHNFVINIEEFLNFLKQLCEKNNINEVYFFSNLLPYSSKYLEVKKSKIYFFTVLLVKGYKKKNKISVISKDKQIKKYCEKIFK